MESKSKDTNLQTLIEIKDIHHRNKSDSILSIEDPLHVNLADDKEDFPTIQSKNKKHFDSNVTTFIGFGSVICFNVFAGIIL